VKQILQIDHGWETVDVRQLDLEALITRFRNLSELSPTSLATYESRFRSGLDSYLAYLDNPTSYQPRGRTSVRRGDVKHTRQQKTGAPATGPVGPAAPSEPPAVSGGAKLVVYPFPVRPNLFAELKLPSDLTTSEARRLGKFLEAVALSAGDDTTE
jgi:hypothetical protein